VAGVSSPAFWEDLYARGADGWELGAPAPPLTHFIQTTPPPRGRVAVPGCGRGHDALYLARHGYGVVAFDFAPTAIREARRLAGAAGVTVDWQQRDLFGPRDADRGAFDGVWEYTCFCAIDPRRRAEYVATVAALLRPGGWLLACFYPLRTYGAGPPFPVSKDEVRRLFVPPFRIEREVTPLRSVSRRQGQEWMVYARKTAAPG
jgi:SAM-dependent methyltransferase